MDLRRIPLIREMAISLCQRPLRRSGRGVDPPVQRMPELCDRSHPSQRCRRCARTERRHRVAGKEGGAKDREARSTTTPPPMIVIMKLERHSMRLLLIFEDACAPSTGSAICYGTTIASVRRGKESHVVFTFRPRTVVIRPPVVQFCLNE